jgi:hypothetical protein
LVMSKVSCKISVDLYDLQLSLSERVACLSLLR